MSELIASFYIHKQRYNLYAWYHSQSDYDAKKIAFYNLHDGDSGICLNDKCPYYNFPTYSEVYDFITEIWHC